MAAGNRYNESLVDQIAHRIELVQGAFRKLSKSSTIKDLGARFAEVVREIMPETPVDLVHTLVNDQKMDVIAGNPARAAQKLTGIRKEKFPSSHSLVEDRDGITVFQRLVDKSTLVLSLGRKTGGGDFTDLDRVSVRLLVQLFDNAYQDMIYRRTEKGLIFSLNHRILQLNSLIETGIEVSKLDHNESPHHLAIVRAASLTNASKGAVTVSVNRTTMEEFTFPVGSTVDRTAEALNCIVASFTFQERTYTFELFDKESRAGIIPFDDTDHLLLDALARQVHASMENRYLHDQALEKQRIEQEMSVAASIQQKILPVSLPEIAGYDLAGVNIPSKSVGGDYYDCLALQDGRFALIIADVAGKGVPAALLVSSLHAYLSAYLEGSFSLPRLTARLNKVLYDASTADKFITAFFAILTPETGELECLNAGHNPAFVLKNDGSVQMLRTGGLPLGTIDIDIPYNSERTVLEKGEKLLLYTDGVTEAENLQHELYERWFPLEDFLAKHETESSESFINDLLTDIRKFTGSAPQNDDITAMHLWRL